MNFKKLTFAVIASLALTTSAFAANKRYVISGMKGSKGRSAVHSVNGDFVKSLRYHDAIVANLSEQAVDRLRANFPSITIEEDIPVSLVDRINKGKPGGGGGGTTTPPPQEVPWGITAVKALDAHALGKKGAGAVVCVVDTGIDKDHEDLVQNIIGGENFVMKKGQVDPNGWDDDNDHGTHVSGTIAAVDNTIGVIGVAPEAKLFGVKVLDRRGSGYTSDVADGVRSCIANNTHVISMSLGSSQSSALLHDAIIDADAAGILVIAAAGNDYGSAVGYPAAHPEAIAVSSMDDTYKLSSFSNKGPEIMYIAPGRNVLSTTKGGIYKSFSGTSMATPHVSGVAALMISAGTSTIDADDIGLSYDEQGNGLVNALNTVQ